MAQVKKFKNPAGPVTDETATKSAGAKKYGKWIRDGVETEMTDESIADFLEYVRQGKDFQQVIANQYLDKIRRGEDVNLNTLLNESNVEPTHYTPEQIENLKKDRAKESIFASMFNTPTHKYNTTTAWLGKWNPSTISNNVKEESKKPTLGLASSGSAFQYKSNPDKTYSYRSLLNTDEQRHWNNWYKYLTDTASRNTFDTSGFTNLDNLTSWFDNMKDAEGASIGKAWLDTLWQKIQNGSELDQDQLDYLTMIGLGHNRTPNKEVAAQLAEQEAATKKTTDWKKYNTEKLWTDSDRDNYFVYGADGSFTLDPSKLHSGFDPSKNYYFNDEFIENNPVGYDWLRNKVYYNGKWYNGNDLKNAGSDLYKMLAAKDYFNMNKRGEYANANNILMTSWNGQENLIPAQSDETSNYIGSIYQSPFLYESKNYNTGKTTLRVSDGQNEDGTIKYKYIPIGTDHIVWRGVDLSESDFLNDGTGRRNWSWRLTDAYGNPISELGGYQIGNDFTQDDFMGLYDGSTAIKKQALPSPKKRISSDKNSAYYNRYLETTPYGFTVYKSVNPKDKLYVTMPSALGGKTYKDMDSEVLEYFNNEEFKNLINNDPKLGRLLVRLMVDGKDDKYLSTKVPELIIRYFKSKRFADAPISSNKKGGVLKAQNGRVVNLGYKPEETSMLSQRADEINAAFNNPYAAQYIRKDGENQLWKGLDKTDRAMLWGLGLDAAGFLAGIVPVYGDVINTALSTIGANIAYGIADSRMEKAGAVAPGTTVRNIVNNTLLDVVGIVPVVGDAADAANWVKKLGTWLKRSNRAFEVIKTAIAGAGIVHGAESLDKLINGEDLTTEDVQALMQGTMALVGLTKRGVHAANEARLAKHSHPGVKEIPYKTKFKNADGTEDELTFNPNDIKEATSFLNRGDVKSKAKLVELIKAKKPNISDEEINRIIGDPKALRDLGLVHETRITGNGFSAAKPEDKPSAWRYFFNQTKRREALTNRTPEQIAVGSTKGKYMKTAASNWLYTKGIGVPEGYQRTPEHWWKKQQLIKSPVEVESTGRTVEESGNSANRVANQSFQGTEQQTRVENSEQTRQTEQANTGSETPRITPETPTRPSIMDSSTAESKLMPKTPSKKKFFNNFNEMLVNDNFKALAEDNPTEARRIVNKAVSELVAKNKATGKHATRLAEKAESMIKGKGYTFKKGGILKGQYGMQPNNFWNNLGETISSPETLNALDSGVRFVLGNYYNDKSSETQKNAIKKAVSLSQPTTPQETYTPNYINAGNAFRHLAESEFQFRPSATTDPNQREAWKKASYDKGNAALAQGINAESQQHSENLLRNVDERRNYAYVKNEAMNQGRKAVASGITAMAGIEDARLKANTESLNQWIYQWQAQRDADINAAKAYADQKNAFDLQQGMLKDYNTWYNKTFTKDKPYDPTNAEHNKAIALEQKRLQTLYQTMGYQNKYKGLSKSSQRWYDLLYAKKGGSLRPASEQIAIDREKAFNKIQVNKSRTQDRIWEASIKDARKALDKMSDRTHKILMKLLS